MMGPPTAVQGLDLLEEKFTEMEESVAKTVDKAMDAMRHSLTEVLHFSWRVKTWRLRSLEWSLRQWPVD